MNIQQLRSFRLACKPELAALVENLLAIQGFRFEPEPFWPLARRLTFEPFPLGGSLAARFGYIYIQDRSSMLPPLGFNQGAGPAAGAAVLDMCASPGSKTGMLAQMTGTGPTGWGSGFVLGNEPSRNRLGTLRANLEDLNLVQCATCSYPGEAFPHAAPRGGWEYIQLDPPCSGWGTVEKNPKVMDLWQGDKVKPLIHIQRQLLKRAFELARPGGQVVYSTCTTNPAENEEQVRFALNELGFLPMPLPAPPGFAFEETPTGAPDGCLRVPTATAGSDGEGGQGFFVAGLVKPQGAAGSSATPQRPDAAPAGEGKKNPAAGRNKSLEVISCAGLSHLLDQPGVDLSLLPPGQGAVAGDTLFFLPELALPLLESPLAWRGFPLGKAGRAGGHFRASPLLHCLMPDLEQAEKRGFGVLNLDDPVPILALLSGQSIPAPHPGPELGLYYKGLPLCRLKVKNNRAMFTLK